MSDISNAALAAQVTALLTRWNGQLDQLSGWLTGAPDGGPNGDGKFPLTSSSGETTLYLSLPSITDLVVGPAALADASKIAAEAASALADNHRLNAENAKSAAQVASAVATSKRDEALFYRNEVAALWANVQTYRDQTLTYKNAAEAAAVIAQASAFIDGGNATNTGGTLPFTIDFGGST